MNRNTEKFTFSFYFHTLTKLLGQPRIFFSELPQGGGLIKPLGFLVVCDLFFAGASLVSNRPPNPVFWASIYFINAVAMALIAAGLGFMVMVMMMGKRVTFTRFFSIYAFSSGVTLLAAWLPYFIWLTEPWKWWLIGTGMVRACKFSRTQAVFVIGVSIGIMVLFFDLLYP
jgi:hypothetical protein